MEPAVVAYDYTSDTSVRVADAFSCRFADPISSVRFRERVRPAKMYVNPSEVRPHICVPNIAFDLPMFKTWTYMAGAICSLMTLTPATFAAQTLPSVISFASEVNSAPQIREVKLEKAKARLGELAKKEAGWKGAESVSMTESVYNATELFLQNYYSIGNMIEPFIGLDGDGDVTLFWKDGNIVIDLSISEDKEYSYFARLRNGKTFSSDQTPVSEPLPLQVLTELLIV